MNKSIGSPRLLPLILGIIVSVTLCPSPTSAAPPDTSTIQRGEVLMRSLRIWPKDENDARDTLKAAEEFGVDRVVWIYQVNEPWIRQAEAKGIHVGTTMTSNAAERWYDTLSRPDAEALAQRFMTKTLDGAHANIGSHFLRFDDPEVRHFIADQTNPAWLDYYVDYVAELYELPVVAIHRDDPGTSAWSIRYGGNFTDSSVAYFRRYLQEHFDTKELKELGVDDVTTFDIRRHFKELGAPTDNTLWKWLGSDLLPVFKNAMMQADADFFLELRRRVEKRSGKHLPWSLNGVGPWSVLDRAFDFRIGEYQSHFNQPQTILTTARYADQEGKIQALISMVQRDYQEDPKFVANTRLNIATAYAAGMIPLVPWCMYMHDAPRYYGSVEDFGDLFHFVSDHRVAFDGHDLVSAHGIDMQAKLYSWLPNKEMHYQATSGPACVWINEDNVFAFVRAKPDADHVSVHLVDWNEQPGPVEVTFDPQAALGSTAADLMILRPQQNPITIMGFTGGVVEIPTLRPWGVMLAKKATPPSDTVAVPQLTAPTRQVVPVGTKVVFADNPDTQIWARFLSNQGQAVPEFRRLGATQTLRIEQAGVIEAYAVHRRSKNRSATMRAAVQVYQDHADDASIRLDSAEGTRLEDRFVARPDTQMKVNASFIADRLMLMGREIEHGISVVGAAEVFCPVDPQWKTFSVQVGVDDAESRRPCARFQVWFDSQLAYETPILNPCKGIILDQERRAFPIALSIPAGAKHIRLRSVPGGFFHDQNTVVWAHPTAY